MTEPFVVSWRGETWGTEESGVHVLQAPGLEDWKASASNVSGGRRAGATRGPLLGDVKTPVLELLVFADSREGMADALDVIRAVSFHEDDMAEFPYQWTVDGEVERTVFARCTDRQIPTDWQTADRLEAVVVQLAFEAADPYPYAAEDIVEFEAVAGEEAVTVAGWASSQRWAWTVQGPVTNPKLTLSVSGFDDQVIRWVGDLAEGEELSVVSTPSSLVATVAGEAVLNLAGFDGGSASTLPGWFRVPAGDVGFRFDGTGSGSCELALRGALP